MKREARALLLETDIDTRVRWLAEVEPWRCARCAYAHAQCLYMNSEEALCARCYEYIIVAKYWGDVRMWVAL